MTSIVRRSSFQPWFPNVPRVRAKGYRSGVRLGLRLGDDEHATGKGNADKAAMVAAMQVLVGHRRADDNEAGALALLRRTLASRTARAGKLQGESK